MLFVQHYGFLSYSVVSLDVSLRNLLLFSLCILKYVSMSGHVTYFISMSYNVSFVNIVST